MHKLVQTKMSVYCVCDEFYAKFELILLISNNFFVCKLYKNTFSHMHVQYICDNLK